MNEARLFWALALLGGSCSATILYFVGDPILRILIGGERAYVASSSSMEPTIRQGERFLRKPLESGDLRRGDLVTFTAVSDGQEAIHLKRIVGRAGDTLQLVDGLVVINGITVGQLELGKTKGVSHFAEVEYRRLREQFPEEKMPHEIYDQRLNLSDNYGPVTVPKNHVFVLGDNRDNSADSRSPKYMPISGPINENRITGRVTTIWWSDDSARRGLLVH
jgi:signal peptidase I